MMKKFHVSLIFICLFVSAGCSQQSEKIDHTSTSENSTAQNEAVQNDVDTQTNMAIASAEQVESNHTGYAYVATGSEPDWTVQVTSDNKLIFLTPNNTDGVALSAERSAYAKGVEYTGTHNNKPFHLNLNGKSCNDTMSDKSYDMTATFEFNGEKYTGCATINQ